MICILLTGPLGSGKSTLSNKISLKYNFEMFDIVNFHSVDSNFTENESKEVYFKLLKEVENAMREKNIIIEAFFTKKSFTEWIC